MGGNDFGAEAEKVLRKACNGHSPKIDVVILLNPSRVIIQVGYTGSPTQTYPLLQPQCGSLMKTGRQGTYSEALASKSPIEEGSCIVARNQLPFGLGLRGFGKMPGHEPGETLKHVTLRPLQQEPGIRTSV